MPHDFDAMARAIKSAVRGGLESVQVAELLVNKLSAAGGRSPFYKPVTEDMRRHVDTMTEAYRIMQGLADGRLQLIEARRAAA